MTGYLHLGQDTMVKNRDVVGVFDLDTSSLSKKTREYLARAQREGRVVNVSTELPKSFVVTATGQDSRVYISQLAAPTLRGRAKG